MANIQLGKSEVALFFDFLYDICITQWCLQVIKLSGYDNEKNTKSP